MHFETDYRLENYILNTRWKDLPEAVRTRLKGCFVDLAGALIVGSRSKQFEAGLRMAGRAFAPGEIPVVGSRERFGFLGAAAAMGHSSNAYDIDDGYNLTGIHPGTSFIGGVLAAGWEQDVLRDEFLTALLVAYESSMRSSHAVIDYYNYRHSSGTFGSLGVAAGAGRLYGFSREQLNNAFSIADFNATMAPGIRSAEYPSMNKDGVPFGVITGVLAVLEGASGFTGNKNLLEADEYRHYLNDLGDEYYVMRLYFKPYPCCRWAQPAIDAVHWLRSEHGLAPDEIAKITIQTFHRATLLSKIAPQTTDEAQYNIAYPVAAMAAHGEFGLRQVREEAFGDPAILAMMRRLEFEVAPDLEAQFPARRIARAQCETADGRKFRSPDFEPRGEASENIGLDWLCAKFRRVTGAVFSTAGQERVLEMVCGGENPPLRDIVGELNNPAHWLD